MLTIAAIDAGSNAMRMVIGQVGESGQVHVLDNIRLPVRLGQDVFSKGYLERKTIEQSEEAFLKFRNMAENFNVQKLRAVATSAAREAGNSDLMVDRISRSSGIQLGLIDGEEEARLIHRAVMHALNLKDKRTLLIDIGGGSIEVTTSTGENIISTASYGLGTVRLLEKLNLEGGDPKTFVKWVREYAEAARHRIEQDISGEKIKVCVGTGGNVEEIGKLRQKLFKEDSDNVVTLDELGELIKRLSHLSYEERIQKWKLRPDRADVILPAAIVLQMIAQEAAVKQILIPNVGLKDGILLDLADELLQQPHPHRREQAWESALHMGRKYKFDEKHGRLTAKLAARLFEQSKALQHLDDDLVLPLEIAALLHDMGHFINAVDHEKHGYYLLTTNHLIGLTPREQSIVANMVLYHRKETPSTKDANFKMLSQQDRSIVNKLTALLRLADSIDVSHDNLVHDVTLSETMSGWQMQIHGRTDTMLAAWAVEKRKDFFEEVFGVQLQIS
jgi:exopolyphosphatase / guanosine-5'-triphosphate,3'-diphosphate pyrophosphatase